MLYMALPFGLESPKTAYADAKLLMGSINIALSFESSENFKEIT
jgi:hypothetical protein